MITAEANPQPTLERKKVGAEEQPGATSRLARQRLLMPVFALLLAAGGLLYYGLVYVPSVDRFNAEQGYSAGHGSDLYSRWYGTRELLAHGRDPYSAAMTAEMQRGFVGRDPRPGEEMPEWAVFAQPLYTAFLLAPLAALDFEQAQAVATLLFPLMVALGALFWLVALGIRASPARVVAIASLALGAPATLYAAGFQQLSAPVFLLLAGGFLLTARGRFAWAGVLLALSTIKPQESWLLIALLICWALFDWRERRGLILGFGGSMLLLVLGAELLLPGWIAKFAASLARYSEQTGGLQIFGALLPMPLLFALAAGWLALLAGVGWQVRREPAGSPRLAVAGAVALAVTVVMIPAYLQYERIYLLPALTALLCIPDPGGIWRTVKRGAVLPLMLSPWMLAAALGGLQLLGVSVLEGPAALKALPWVPYLVLPYLAALSLLPLIGRPGAIIGNRHREA